MLKYLLICGKILIPDHICFCGSCEKSYNFTDITPETILKNLKTYDEEKAKRIATQINHYYSGTDVILTTLILDYCTGIVRPFRTKIPYITNKLLKQKLHVCFNYNHQRTYLAITKITFGSKKDKLNYYDYDSLVMSI